MRTFGFALCTHACTRGPVAFLFDAEYFKVRKTCIILVRIFSARRLMRYKNSTKTVTINPAGPGVPLA